MSLVGFKAKNHPQTPAVGGVKDDTDDRRTLPEVFDPLHAEHGFTLDAAASDINAKLPRYFTKERDGLRQPWTGEVVWCNPPYSDIGTWVAKAFQEVAEGCRKVVLLLPANRCEQRWWQKFIEPVRDRGLGVSTKFLPGRPRFGFPESRPRPVKGDRPPFGLVVVVIERKR